MQPPYPTRLSLAAGPLTMVFEPDTAFLRTIKLGNVEVLRGIYAALRDFNWDTAPPVLTNLDLCEESSGFTLTFDVRAALGEADYVWKGKITGSADGRVRFEMDGEAQSTFRRNRVGFCVLHSFVCAGMPCTLEKTDGSKEEAAFPEMIAPHQPFLDLRAITHEVAPGVKTTVTFEGDIFETEDQRNWSDASFKTYCTPLERPFPVTVEKGRRIKQAVDLCITGAPEADTGAAPSDTVEVNVNWGTRSSLPQIGLGTASHKKSLTEREVGLLKSVRPAHIRVDVRMAEVTWENDLRAGMEAALKLGASLEIALLLSADASAELERLKKMWLRLAIGIGGHVPVARWLVLSTVEPCTTTDMLEEAKGALAHIDFSAEFFVGTNAYFAQLNRATIPTSAFAGLCYSINPQVHAFDNRTMVENTEAQADTVASARAKVPNTKIAVTPVTLKPRFNPDATGPEPVPAPEELPTPVEPRQKERFTAGWTLGSLKALTQAETDSVTYFETTGWRGIVEADAGAPLPELFGSAPGSVYPVYHLFADIGSLVGNTCHEVHASDPLTVAGLAFKGTGSGVLLLANLTDELQAVRMHVGSFTSGSVRQLDASTETEAALDPGAFRSSSLPLAMSSDVVELTLGAYAYLRIDLTM